MEGTETGMFKTLSDSLTNLQLSLAITRTAFNFEIVYIYVADLAGRALWDVVLQPLDVELAGSNPTDSMDVRLLHFL